MRRAITCLLWLLLALLIGLFFLVLKVMPVSATDAAAVASPVSDLIGAALVDAFRIEDGWRCGGSAQRCMWGEDDALILARVAIGESPSSPNDQIYIMWLIRFRAYLGFKNAGAYSGWENDPARWGPATSIKREALCSGGCQFSPVRAADDIYFGCSLRDTHPLRKMLCPTDEQLPDFAFAYGAAQQIVAAPITDFPVELRGYDNFRSPSITGPGQFNGGGGLRSAQFWPRANIWRDEFTDDNLFWAAIDETREGGP